MRLFCWPYMQAFIQKTKRSTHKDITWTYTIMICDICHMNKSVRHFFRVLFFSLALNMYFILLTKNKNQKKKMQNKQTEKTSVKKKSSDLMCSQIVSNNPQTIDQQIKQCFHANRSKYFECVSFSLCFPICLSLCPPLFSFLVFHEHSPCLGLIMAKMEIIHV